MTVRRVARFRPHRLNRPHASDSRRLLVKGVLRVLDLVAISVAILLVAAPFVWKRRRADEVIDAWTLPRMNDVSRVETDWMTLPRPPEFTRGDEVEVKDFLRTHPLVAAIQGRRAPRALWIRQGDILVKAGENAEASAYRRWFAKSEQDQCFLWNPLETLPDEERPGPKIILLGDPWLVAKRWKEGSPEVEQAFKSLLGNAHAFRVALIKDGDENRKDLKPQPWGAEPNLQADPYRGLDAPFSTVLVSNEFPGWSFTVIPLMKDGAAYRRYLNIQFMLAAAAAATVGGSLVLALYLRSRSRRKAALDSDRMASMTHSLKTPLAILKFRCDTLRLGRLSPDQLDAQLIQVGEEADRLSGIIENALMAIQGSTEAGPQGEVTPQWISSIAEDLAPAFEAVNRHLVLTCTEQSGKAALPSLRAALFTLVENALFHGEGTVTLETIRTRKRFLIKVSDEGTGLDSLDMKTLGRPFMRIREKGKEGFRKDGQGLGLSLLTKVVEREGWGLTFASEPGRGLCATLEIRAS